MNPNSKGGVNNIMLILNFLVFIIGCEPLPGSTIIEDNDRIGLIGFGVIVFAFILQFVINKMMFNKFWSKAMIFYIALIVLYLLVNFFGAGDCGDTFADSGIVFAIMSVFLLIFSPIISRAIAKHRQNQNSTPPFAKPDRK